MTVSITHFVCHNSGKFTFAPVRLTIAWRPLKRTSVLGYTQNFTKVTHD